MRRLSSHGARDTEKDHAFSGVAHLCRPIMIPSVEFLVEIEVSLPHDLEPDRREELARAEAERGGELARAGRVLAIWRVPGQLANRGIWSAPDATVLHEAITSLPMWRFMRVQVTPLARHHLAEACQGIPRGLTPASD